jgi:quinohemoprotein ethanol dehydrogenase
VNPEAHYDQNKETVTLSPSPNGAHNWSPMSFNPSTGLVYIPTTTDGTRTFAVEPDFVYKPGDRNTGILRTGLGQARPTPSAIGPVPPEGQHFALVAWDPVTQKERWRTTGGGAVGGGTVTTAGNLVFQVMPDGHFVAYSADKGEKLIDIQTGLRGGMAPPITYMLDGKQYVAFLGGQGMVLPPLPNAPPPAPGAVPGNAPSGGTAPPKLLTFVLDGKGQLESR